VRRQEPCSRARSRSAPVGARCLDRHCRWCIGPAMDTSARSVLSHAGSSLLSVSALQVVSADCTALLWSFASRPFRLASVADAGTSGLRWLDRRLLLFPDWPRHWPVLSQGSSGLAGQQWASRAAVG
jgi:hypothetical protein